jgi:hypothetical protein
MPDKTVVRGKEEPSNIGFLGGPRIRPYKGLRGRRVRRHFPMRYTTDAALCDPVSRH